LKVKETQELSAIVTPNNATNQTITYTSVNTAIATITSGGAITAISAGSTTIIIEAGGIKKELSLLVKVVTENLELNQTYLVLKIGEWFTITAKVSPPNADQKITYESTDKNVAAVSADGLVRAIKAGTASVIVTNGDMTKIVSLIVGGGNTSQGKPDLDENDIPAMTTASENFALIGEIENLPNDGKITVKRDTLRIVTSDVLSELLGTAKTLEIEDNAYTFAIYGKDIRNIENELSTEILMTSTGQGLECFIGNGQNLPGKLKIHLNGDETYKHLYLYSENKSKYEEINTLSDKGNFTVDVPGKYLLTTKKLSNVVVNWIFILSIAVILIGAISAYIAVKKKHWFW
jgi:hypothetical protein